ncbi:MAG TPA: class I SAM-dependent methyltransferase [Acidimicrobiales bacterium]|nr:class I SAM-dependent methyltransferase [Acidimicrobiales bacterium]
MTTTEMPPFDPAVVEEFAGRIAGTVTAGVVTLMIDIGHRTGLFEAAAAGPATSAELAERAGLSERYVREWLGAVSTAGIFRYDPDAGTFTLPVEHALLLTGGGSSNLAVLAPLVGDLARHVGAVTEAFRTGAGVPYDCYRPEFTTTMDEVGRRTYDEALVDGFLAAAPGLVERLRQGITAADLGCGAGHVVNLLGRAFPASTFVGFDIAEDALEAGRREAQAWGLDNVRFERHDVAQLPATARFDLVTAFDAVHDQADPAGVLRRAHDALADDGTFFMVDIKASSDLANNLDNPLAPMLYGISVMHCMSVSLAAGGAGLGTAWGRELACEMLAAAGFTSVSVHELPQDVFNLIYVCKPR